MKILNKENLIKNNNGVYSAEVIFSSDDGKLKTGIYFFVTEEYLGSDKKIYPGENVKAAKWFEDELDMILSKDGAAIFGYKKWEYDYSIHGIAKNPIKN